MILRSLVVLVGLAWLAVSPAQAQENPYISARPGDELHGGKLGMNGYTFAQFKGFEKSWQLVTVRFRKDTGEMRFTYANPLAWATMKAGKTDYPDGAIFAKFSAKTEDDPSFINSLVPSGAQRYQFMVRDKQRHKDTAGWGYAIFGADGLTLPGHPVAVANACNACHLLIPEKGYVFSEPFTLTGAAFGLSATNVVTSRIPFTIATTRSLPPKVKALIPEAYKEVRLVRGALAQHLFGGTLDEIRPTLLAEAKRTEHPAVLHGPDGLLFSVVWPVLPRQDCTTPEGAKGRHYTAASSNIADLNTQPLLRTFCQ